MAHQADIEHHYDDPEYWRVFQTILGQHHVYSCGQWEEAQSLDDAQDAKVRKMLGFAGVTDATRSLVDIGSGWGGALAYLRQQRPGCTRAVGVTVCRSQAEISRGLFADDPVIEIVLGDCFDYLSRTSESFEAAISLCAFEHFATPKQFRSGAHLDTYSRFFALVRARVTGRFGLQTIVVTNAPVSDIQRRGHFRMLLMLGRELFPNSLLSSLPDLERASAPYYRIDRQDVHTDNYVRTLGAWRDRLEHCRDAIKPSTYDFFRRYFDNCMRQFEQGTIALAQLSLVPR